MAANAPLFEGQLEGLKSAFALDVEDVGPERRRLGGSISSLIATKTGRAGGGQRNQFAGNLAMLMKKAKVRGGIRNRGEAAIKNQQLKDRLAIARSAAGRRGQAISALGSAERTRLGLETSLRSAKDQTSSAFFGAAGGVAGTVAAGVSDKIRTQRDVDEGLQTIFDDPELF